MGLDKATIQALLLARQAGVSFDRVLTVGRQQLLYVTPNELRGVLSRNGIAVSLGDAKSLFAKEGGYCEPLLRLLGARAIDSLDASEFEGATIIHDLNKPLPARYHRHFTLVLDGGSLEHVFNFPTALSSCMQAVSVGGHLIVVSPANNLMGHGFYQFSPEIFYRALSPENGFDEAKIFLYEYPWASNIWYEPTDPKVAGARVGLTNRRQVYMVAWAKRFAEIPIFEQSPQQSDYEGRWQKFTGQDLARSSVQKRPVYKAYAPQWIRDLYFKAVPFGSSLYKKVRF